MKVRDLKQLTDAELVQRIDDSKDELFNLKFRLVTGQLDNPARIREVKRNIARAKTIQRQRELMGIVVQ